MEQREQAHKGTWGKGDRVVAGVGEVGRGGAQDGVPQKLQLLCSSCSD